MNTLPALVTYTNSKCLDVLNVHLGQIERFAHQFPSYVLIDDLAIASKHPHHTFIRYDNADPYYVHWINSLNSIPQEKLIYLQEDFWLYDRVNEQKIQSYVKFLDNTSYSFVRLIRACFDFKLNHVQDDLYAVNRTNEDIFHMQATLWKKTEFVKLYNGVKSVKWLENQQWRDTARQVGIDGVYAYNNEKQRGRYHFDSIVWPYVCTAVNRGFWNYNEYPEIVPKLLEEHGIDPEIRGKRDSYEYHKLKKR